jgi:death-on-curing protein
MAQKTKPVRPKQMANVRCSGHLTADEIRRIHERLCQDFAESNDPINPPGVRDPALLESAVGRQGTGWAGIDKYPTALANAATLTFGVCNDHPFYNGNKRTALVAMLAHLDRNRLTLRDTRQNELFNLMLDVAQGQLSQRGSRTRGKRTQPRPTPDEEVDALAEWLSRRTRPVTRGEHDMTFRELRQVLRRFEYDLDNPRNGSINIVRLVERKRGLIRRETVLEKKSIGNISYPGDTKMVGVKKIKQIRRLCRLTEEDRVDSSAFYDGTEAVDAFINEYRTVLRRLAKR